MPEGYAVMISHNGKTILTIERHMLAGKSELSDEDAAAIREAAMHLLAFIGAETPKQ